MESTSKPPLFRPQQWVAGMSNQPVFIDGLTHRLFYLIVGCKSSASDYEAVVIGKFGPDRFKVKFYPGFEAFGFTLERLRDEFNATLFLSRQDSVGYIRYMTDREGVQKLLEALPQARNAVVAPLGGVWSAFELPGTVREKVSTRLHPQRGGYKPEFPFVGTGLLQTTG